MYTYKNTQKRGPTKRKPCYPNTKYYQTDWICCMVYCVQPSSHRHLLCQPLMRPNANSFWSLSLSLLSTLSENNSEFTSSTHWMLIPYIFHAEFHLVRLFFSQCYVHICASIALFPSILLSFPSHTCAMQENSLISFVQKRPDIFVVIQTFVYRPQNLLSLPHAHSHALVHKYWRKHIQTNNITPYHTESASWAFRQRKSRSLTCI